MEVKAFGKFLRVSTRKARIPAQIVKGMNAVEAVYVLKYMPKGAAHEVKKVLESAIANAKHNFGLNESELLVADVSVDKGPALRRVEYKAKGGVRFYNRPMSHITVVVKDNNEVAKKTSKTKATKVESKPAKKVKTSTKVAKDQVDNK
jgi:large subunit ribosomal protein L22